MNRRLLAILFIFFVAKTFAQENKIITINQTQNTNEEFTKAIYQYPQFITGKAIFRNGSVVEAKFNYNYLSNQVVFIDPKGDSLALDMGETLREIVIQTDTFYYNQGGFIQKLTHHPSHNLFIKRTLKYADTEKKGAYGTYSNTTSTSSVSTISDGHSEKNIATDANIIYRLTPNFFVSDKFNNFSPLTKKDVYDVFSKNEKQVKAFVKNNNIDFNKKTDLEKLIQYIQTLL